MDVRTIYRDCPTCGRRVGQPDDPAAACRQQPPWPVLRGLRRPSRPSHLPHDQPPTSEPGVATTACMPRLGAPASPRRPPPAGQGRAAPGKYGI